MKKDFFYVLLILVLIKAATSPLPNLLSQPENKKATTTTVTKPNPEQPAETADCNFLDQQGSDDLAVLTSQASTKTNACLFLGCNGFF